MKTLDDIALDLGFKHNWPRKTLVEVCGKNPIKSHLSDLINWNQDLPILKISGKQKTFNIPYLITAAQESLASGSYKEESRKKVRKLVSDIKKFYNKILSMELDSWITSFVELDEIRIFYQSPLDYDTFAPMLMLPFTEYAKYNISERSLRHIVSLDKIPVAEIPKDFESLLALVLVNFEGVVKYGKGSNEDSSINNGVERILGTYFKNPSEYWYRQVPEVDTSEFDRPTVSEDKIIEVPETKNEANMWMRLYNLRGEEIKVLEELIEAGKTPIVREDTYVEQDESNDNRLNEYELLPDIGLKKISRDTRDKIDYIEKQFDEILDEKVNYQTALFEIIPRILENRGSLSKLIERLETQFKRYQQNNEIDIDKYPETSDPLVRMIINLQEKIKGYENAKNEPESAKVAEPSMYSGVKQTWIESKVLRTKGEWLTVLKDEKRDVGDELFRFAIPHVRVDEKVYYSARDLMHVALKWLSIDDDDKLRIAVTIERAVKRYGT